MYFLDHGYSTTTAREAQAGVDKLLELGTTDEADSLELIRTAQVAKATHAPRHAAAAPLPDGKTVPVPAEDPRLQRGDILERVEVGGRRSSTPPSTATRRAPRRSGSRPTVPSPTRRPTRSPAP